MKSFNSKVLAVMLSCIIVVSLCNINSYAVGFSWDIIPVVYDLGDRFGISFKDSIISDLFNNLTISGTIADWLERKNMDMSVDDFMNENYTENEDGSVTTTNTFNQFVYDTMSDYVADNPLTYHVCTIPSYLEYNKDWISNYSFWEYYVQAIKGKNDGQGYVLVTQIGQGGGNPQYGVDMIHIKDTSNFGLYGTVSGNLFTNVHPIYKWNASNNCLKVDDNNLQVTEIVSVYNPTVTPNMNPTSIFWSVNAIYNDTVQRSNHSWTIMSATESSQSVYVFDSLAVYKNFSTGTSQDYYIGPGGMKYSGGSTISADTLSNVGNTYTTITNNIKNGLTADEVAEIVKKALEGQGTGGGGSSPGIDIDFNPGSIIPSLSGLKGDYTTGFAQWLGSVFSFMPPEFKTVLVLAISLSIGFFIIRLIRGF